MPLWLTGARRTDSFAAMSDEQLSWDNIFVEKAAEPAVTDLKADSAVPFPAPNAAPTPSKSKALAQPKSGKEDVTLFSKMDWGPLHGPKEATPQIEPPCAGETARTVEQKNSASVSTIATGEAFDALATVPPVAAIRTPTRVKVTSATLSPRPLPLETGKVNSSSQLGTSTAASSSSNPMLRSEPAAPASHSKTFLDSLLSPPTTSVPVRVDFESSARLSSVPSSSMPSTAQLQVRSVDDEASLVGEKPGAEPKVISVYEINKQIRGLLEGRFPLLWVRGEISNFKAHTSGHFYFSLKDAKAQISAVMFRGFNQSLKFRPEDGMEVIVRCRVTVYEPRGNYQLFCELMDPVGAGALQKAFEQLKAKLQSEGLFAPTRKRPLPSLPRHIAIVTSPTGAAIRDMLNVLGRRFKGARVTVVPTKVQGEQAAGEICAAIALANQLPDVDVMIVGRGGGSIEDMWCFNDERVARAIAAARVPVISAVGHEIDFTIADFVADLRAPTPSAAAELVVKNASDLQDRIQGLQRSASSSMLRRLADFQQKCVAFAKRLVIVDPQRRIQDCMQRNDELSQRLEASILRRFAETSLRIALWREKLGHPEQAIGAQRQRVEGYAQRLSLGWKTFAARKRRDVEKQMALLDSLSPLRVVERGYSVVTLNEQVVTDVTALQEGDVVCLQFARGRASAAVKKIENKKGVLERV